MNDLVKLFCMIDDFWKTFEPEWKKHQLGQGIKKVRRPAGLSMSEVMTILILFQTVGFRNFKTFYVGYILTHLKRDFPGAPSYTRFLELKKQAIFPMYCFLLNQMGKCTGISYIDSTSLEVCHLKRTWDHRVFKGMARKGKTTKGWFYGFKLHIVTNQKGELLAFALTPGNVNDRKPVQKLCKHIFGKLFGDKGYISKCLFEDLQSNGVQLVTKLKNNMKNKLMSLTDRILLKKRGIIESIIDQLKNIFQIEHSRHRSPVNFIVNLLSGMVAYSLQSNKPTIRINENERILLQTI